MPTIEEKIANLESRKDLLTTFHQAGNAYYEALVSLDLADVMAIDPHDNHERIAARMGRHSIIIPALIQRHTDRIAALEHQVKIRAAIARMKNNTATAEDKDLVFTTLAEKLEEVI